MSKSLETWKAVKPIFESLFDFPLPVALNKLEAMEDIDEAAKSAVRRLLFGVHTKNTLIESSGQALLSKHLEQSRDMSGEHLGDYHLLSLISTGGMSSIYLAERKDGSIQKKVAIKVLPPWKVTKESHNLFVHEQQVLSKLRHPNIVTMHHGGVSDDGVYYMVMDFLENATPLDQYVKLNQLNHHQIVSLILVVANAIAYAHGNLVIHRDLKASNILIDDNGHVHLVDFGIASSDEEQEDKNLRVYTPEIASPEQILGHKITVTTDIFSLAATTLNLLLQEKSLPDVDPKNYDPMEDEIYLSQVLDGSDLPFELKAIFTNAMNTDPQQRYQSMNRFAADLANWLENKPISILNDSRVYQFKKLISRNKTIASMVLMMFVLVLIGLGLVANYAKNAYDAAKQADASVSFLTDILNQADPLHAKHGDITIREILEKNSDIPLNKVNGDWVLKDQLHQKLAGIYTKLGLFEEAIAQLNMSLTSRENITTEPDEQTLVIKNDLAYLYFTITNNEKAIQLSQEVLVTMEQYGIDNESIRLNTMANLMQSYGLFTGSNLYDEAKYNETKEYLLKALENEHTFDDDTLIKIYSRLAVEVQKDKDFKRAEEFFERSLVLTETKLGKSNYDYLLLYHDFAIAKIRQKKMDEAEDMLNAVITELKQIDENNSLLGRAWETYSTLLMMTDRREESIKALDQATAILERIGDSTGLYYALSKRAMYQFEIYRFRAGIQDQIRFIPDLLETAGHNSPTLIAGIAHLMLMFNAIEENDMANEILSVMQQEISVNDIQFKNLLSYMAYVGISNLYFGNHEKAQEIHDFVELYNENHERSLYELFNYLMTHDNQYGIDMAFLISPENDKMTFYQRLRFSVQYIQELAPFPLNEAQLSQICELNKPFIRFRNIEFKRMFLENCQQLYSINQIPVALDIKEHLQLIDEAITQVTTQERESLKKRALVSLQQWQQLKSD